LAFLKQNRAPSFWATLVGFGQTDATGHKMTDQQSWFAFLIIVISLHVAVIWFVVRILNRLGLSGWWSLMLLFWPLGLGLLAFCRWPAVDKDVQKVTSASHD
jgi:hypothetical protein